MKDLTMQQALCIIRNGIASGKNIRRVTLTKQDGARYKFYDGIIMSTDKCHVPLVIDLNDRWSIVWK